MVQTIYVASLGCALSHAQMIAISAANLMAKSALEDQRFTRANISLAAPLARVYPLNQ